MLPGLLAYFFPYKKPQVTLTHSTIYIGHTVFAKQNFENGTKVVGQGESAEDDLYVLATVHIQNPLKVPLTLNDFTALLTGADGSEMQTSAVEKNQFDTVFTAYPELKPMTGTPLLRETVLAPGQARRRHDAVPAPGRKDRLGPTQGRHALHRLLPRIPGRRDLPKN